MNGLNLGIMRAQMSALRVLFDQMPEHPKRERLQAAMKDALDKIDGMIELSHKMAEIQRVAEKSMVETNVAWLALKNELLDALPDTLRDAIHRAFDLDLDG